SRPQMPQEPRSAPQRPPVAARSSTAVPDPVWDGLTVETVEQDLRQRSSVVPPVTSSELFSLAEKAGLDKRLIGDTAKRLYGSNAWRITALTDEQRQAVAEELELVPA